MSDPVANLDLSVLPPAYRAAFEELKTLVERQEALIHELNQALYGKKSERLAEDERQLAFEDLEVAVSEVEETRDAVTAALEARRPKRKPVNRNLGNLPENLPRIEEVIEPDSLQCPCGCGRMHQIGEDRSERLDIVPAQLL